MSADIPGRVCHLLAQSLEAWHLAGDVRLEADGTVLLRTGGKKIRVSSAVGDLPFRWMLTEGDRTHGVTSIAGLLRAVRVRVDPGYRPIRLRLAPLPPLPP